MAVGTQELKYGLSELPGTQAWHATGLGTPTDIG